MILIPQPGMKLAPTTLEDEVLTTGWPGKSRNALFKLDINNVSAVCQFKAGFYRLRGKIKEEM